MSNQHRTTREVTGTTTREESRAVMGRREAIVGVTVRMLIILTAVAFALFPVLFIASSAFNPAGTLSTGNLVPPGVESLDELVTNFRALLVDDLALYPFWNWILNSFIVASISTSLVVLITALSAYAFSRFRFRGRRSLLLAVLLIQVFPNLLAMVALFLILLEIGQLVETIP
ncbi:MAG: sugar ABC transporter permease, partial [Phototrophicaceae bacterium]